jgi:hypothetical protein
MSKNPLSKDIDAVLNDNITDKELEDLKQAVRSYMKSRGLSDKSTKDQVDLVLLLFTILEVPEKRFMDFISRLNVLQLKRMGAIESIKSGQIH